MSKRIIALLLCAVMLLPCLASCAKKDEENPDLGAYITMYLTDDIYDFDPAYSNYNLETQNVLRLMYETLFTLDKNGKLKNSLVKNYEIVENERDDEYFLTLNLRDDIFWSNGDALTSDHVVYTFKRLLNSNNSFPAASLLYDIKNARAVKEGDCSIDDIGVEAVEPKVVKIIFEGKIDYNEFLINLTNIATAPLHETYVNKSDDWAKKSSTMLCSGPFKIGKISYDEVKKENGITSEKESDDFAFQEDGSIVSGNPSLVKKITFFYLERNIYYKRDTEHDAIDSAVTPYRLLVDCTKSDSDILKDYKEGKLFYVGQIPMSVRQNKKNSEYLKKNVEVTNALSTFVCFLNHNATIADGGAGTQLFANADVRHALSLALDRSAIAKAVVYAEAATALVGPGIFEGNKVSKDDFRTIGGTLLNTKSKMSEAKAILEEAGINPSKYSFTIKVSANDDVNLAIAYMIQEAWDGRDAETGDVKGLGFKVTVKPVKTIENNDYSDDVGDVPTDICDDPLTEALRFGNYEVVACDYNAYSANAYSMLSNFAFNFSGMAMTIDPTTQTYYSNGHICGYNSKAYNDIMEAIYFLPYIADLTEGSSEFLGLYDTEDEFAEVYNRVWDVYDEYKIQPSRKTEDWTKLKAKLLHEAERILLEDDMALIPVIFNQNAVMISDDLSRVDTDYYTPALFKKTKLKNYHDYDLVLAKFPTVDWSKKGKEAETTGKK